MSCTLHRYASVTAAAIFLLLIAGGLVTSTDSGLAVPDWPLSYGTLFPPMVGGILYEHGHRMIAAIVAMMIVALTVWLWRAESRRWVRLIGACALIGVLLQALLGGLTVLWLLPPLVSVAHACLGPIVFCLVVCLAVCTAPTWQERPSVSVDPEWSTTQRIALATGILAGVQLVLGAILRHTGIGLAWHLAGAATLVLLTGGLVQRTRHEATSSMRFHADVQRLVGLMALQVMLGGVAWWRPTQVALVTAHVAVGSLVLAQAVVVAWQAARVRRGASISVERITGAMATEEMAP